MCRVVFVIDCETWVSAAILAEMTQTLVPGSRTLILDLRLNSLPARNRGRVIE